MMHEGEKRLIESEFQSALRTISDKWELEFARIQNHVASFETILEEFRDKVQEERQSSEKWIKKREDELKNLGFKADKSTEKLSKIIDKYPPSTLKILQKICESLDKMRARPHDEEW